MTFLEDEAVIGILTYILPLRLVNYGLGRQLSIDRSRSMSISAWNLTGHHDDATRLFAMSLVEAIGWVPDIRRNGVSGKDSL